ncbi:NAD(P)H-quinone oxidoreductase [Paraglaciecola hydrolytica]|uniref:Zinc-binding alcohol dehydrogenase n=1 Tax=Paraglaciecola hydrolytica TaxID=1799789 RepID=A0A136A6I5_9ALTE|nr:NAD(P)H-quinone oxidoreductase [Paraglaciecola hydrolytica]KXI30833.1 zinc-binding alcohol dehydrogenase [Paraglaciecola hydrolytica]
MRFIDFTPGCSAQELAISETAMPRLIQGQVLVKVGAFGINRADLLQRAGKYPAPDGESPILGLEIAGEIIEISAGLATRFKVGDKVFGLVAGGAYAEYVAVHASHLLPLPASMDYIQGAALAECFLTAYQAMFVEYQLQERSSVLIHAGASGVGLAAIQLAKQANCKVVVTASSAEKLAVCLLYGADLRINYIEVDFVEVLKSQTPQPIDLIIDFVGGAYVNRNLAVLNRDGCIVQLAMLGGRYVENLDMALMLGKRATIKASTLRNRSDAYKTALTLAFERDCWAKLDSGQLKAVIDASYSASEIAQAHGRMENNLNMGKLVCYW